MISKSETNVGKKFKTKQNKNNNSSKNNRNSEQTDSNLDEDDDLEFKIDKNEIQYNMPKPGPHAKAGEWRKWKMMKRSIRQEREEMKLIKRQKKEENDKIEAELNQNQPENIKKRNYTMSIAIPGSIMGKVQSKELKTYVAGQIARAATIFCIDEIIVYNEYAIENKQQTENNEQLIKILEYLECPQYLRKSLFPPHKYLEHVGLLHPLEAPHHFKINDNWQFREGVVTDIPSKEDKGSWVDIGLLNKIQIDKKLQAGIRVTVKKQETVSGKLKGLVVSPETPRVENGLYWGYQVRYANAFRKIIYESSFKQSYDLKIGIDLNGNKLCLDHIDKLPSSKRVLIVFGGLNGVEAAIEADEKLRANKSDQIFNFICESDNNDHLYGSRSVRLEEALLISLAVLRPKIIEANENSKDDDQICDQKIQEGQINSDKEDEEEEEEKEEEEKEEEEKEKEEEEGEEEESED